MQSMDGDLEQQDSRGWTPIMWSSSNGYCKLVKQLVQRGADVHHIGQARGGNGTTTALHECAAMRGERAQPSEGYFETAWLLMAAGASPFTERSDGMTPIEAAGSCGNLQMKKFLEGCCLFRGTLAMPVPQAFGSKVKNRYCTVQPRFPLGNAAPTLWMVCYRNTNEMQPACKIPLGNARVMIEGPHDSENGILIVPSSSKVPKGVHVRSHTANSYIVEIRAVALAKMPGWKTLRTLADVCKAAGVAVSCRNLDQLCSAALAQAVQQMQLPGKGPLPDLNKVLGQSDKPPAPAAGAQSGEPPLKPVSIPEEKPVQIADSAQDMVPERSKLSSQQILEPSEPGTPRGSGAESAQPRRSGLGSLFKSAFRMSSSTAPRKYNTGLLDSSSSLGQMSTASQQSEPAKKSGLFSFKKKSAHPARAAMPSITEQSAGGLTEADMTAFSQPIPDKFWSKMGRKMSSQRKPNLAAYRSNVQNWFHEDDGTVSSTGLPPARPSKKSFEEEDLTELMYPAGEGPRPAVAAPNPRQPQNIRRQTTDSARPRTPHGSVPFVLEEPIVPTQRMVHAGPRRSFSFDDLDDMVNGGNRKARGHREDFVSQMAPANPRRQQIGLQGSELDHQRMHAGQRLPQEVMSSTNLMKTRSSSMPRRSFSLHDLDQMLQAPPAPAPPQDLRGGSGRSQEEQQQRSAVRRKGPAIDPDSYGGFQGPPAPEWRPYKPASARSIPQQQQGRPQQGNLPQEIRSDPRLQAQAEHHHLQRQGSGQLHHRHNPQPTAAHHTAPYPSTHHHPQQHPHHHQQIATPQHQHHPSQQQQQHHHQQHRPASRQVQHQSLPQQQGAPVQRGQPIPQSFQQARPGPPPPARQSHRSGSLQGIPPELAHLASLRALETGNLFIPSLPSKKDSASLERALSSNSASAPGEENKAANGNLVVAYEGADERKSQSKVDPGVMTMPIHQKKANDGEVKEAKPSEEAITSIAKATPLAPAVPSVLFGGVKIPKNPTPPTRIAREKDEIPEIRHSGSHEFTESRI